MKDVDAAALVELCRARESLSLQYHERDESTMACTGLEWQCRFPDTCSLQFTERPRVIQRNAVSSALFLTFNSVDCSYRTEKSIVHVFFFFFFFFARLTAFLEWNCLAIAWKLASHSQGYGFQYGNDLGNCGTACRAMATRNELILEPIWLNIGEIDYTFSVRIVRFLLATED